MGRDSNKRKKHHDRDKYYKLAKEQGFRSRAAFKLSQINRQHPDVLRNATTILDLCAAPGGWTQVAARGNSSATVVAVDILPIRALGRNVTTLVGDITTATCQASIRKALPSSGKVDTVLHDGAPQVGADYGRDAYVQNELVLAAAKCAVQHLKRGGAFVTKVYRSRDSPNLVWALRQLFAAVHTVKPAASRLASAEIFLVCLDYQDPAKVDARLLDATHLFAPVAGDSTGGGNQQAAGNAVANPHVLGGAKKKKQRQRNGYDMDHFDATMRHIRPVREFVFSETANFKGAVKLLSQCTGLRFRCDDANCGGGKDEAACTYCSFLLENATAEIKESVTDLQVLNPADFKGLLNWRTKMQDSWKHQQQVSSGDGNEFASRGDDDSSDNELDMDSDQEDAEVQKEIAEMVQRRQRERKRLKKKERALKTKRRRKAAMDVLTIDGADDPIFSLSTLETAGDLHAAADVNLDTVETDEQVFGRQNESSEEDEFVNEEDNEHQRAKRESELDAAYEMYLENTKNGMAKTGTKMAKRSKKLQRQQLMEEATEDQEMAQLEDTSYNARTYAQMLQGPKGSDSSSDDDDDDDTSDSEASVERKDKSSPIPDKPRGVSFEPNPLIHKFAESSSEKTARWFSNPLFCSVEKLASASNRKENPEDANDNASGRREKADKRQATNEQPGLSAEEIIASLPKTDKQKRHEKRVKARERDERRQARRAKQLGEEEKDFSLVPAENDEEDSDDEGATDAHLAHLSESRKKKVLQARELISAGIGKVNEGAQNGGIEIVPGVEGNDPLANMVDRDYANEEYDSDDYAETLALGTMMLRRSKEKAFVDASYNRYAWNDPADLPEWFVDDETRHHRPQLPIPPALIAKMKEKMLALSARPIKKVAEARARKSKRAKMKLDSAKKRAEAVARSSEMTESMKLKAISKALRGHDSKKPGKSYVVAKKGRQQQGGKGVKVVDKRMRSDKRALERIEKKRKHGKQNKLVGSKKRRRHK